MPLRPSSSKYQKGLSMWQMAYVLGSLGVFGIVGMKALPLYLENMKVERAVKKTSTSGDIDPVSIRRELHRIWAIEDIKTIQPEDIKVVRVENGAALTYDYEASVPLFGNASLVMHYVGNERISASVN